MLLDERVCIYIYGVALCCVLLSCFGFNLRTFEREELG